MCTVSINACYYTQGLYECSESTLKAGELLESLVEVSYIAQDLPHFMFEEELGRQS